MSEACLPTAVRPAPSVRFASSLTAALSMRGAARWQSSRSKASGTDRPRAAVRRLLGAVMSPER
jgi:hypothetical protein